MSESKGREIIPIEQPRAIMPAMSIEAAVEQWKQYQELKQRIGTDDDFQTIGSKKHPCKSFVRKCQRFFSVSCEILKDEPWRDLDGNIIGWMFTVRAIHSATGLYQDADGSCEFSEKRSANQRTLHNVRAHALTRAKNRAILDLVGFGEVSAEEIIEEKQEQRERKKKADKKPVEGKGDASPIIPSGHYEGRHLSDPEIPMSYLIKTAADMELQGKSAWAAKFYHEIEQRKAAAGVTEK